MSRLQLDQTFRHLPYWLNFFISPVAFLARVHHCKTEQLHWTSIELRRHDMKVLICGKGGCGKSTMTALIAKALAQQGTKVLVIDTDESNMCLHRLLGASRPDILMDAMGGRSGTREKLNPSLPHRHDEEFFKEIMAIDDLPSQCISHAGKIRMLMIGKIKEYGEGCACMIGGVSKAVLSRLRENENEIVLIDAEAGLEHFGRRVDANCDLVRSEERRVGKECGRLCRSRWSPYH
jgi:energy-coupling factor transporter ATP-binding protein EcfA2